ncbi:MAG TPA: hypothetical protein VF002_00065 [Gaiellaceae bacterium]
MAAWTIVLQPLGLALGLPLSVLVLGSAVAGAGLAVHLAFWFTVFQEQVPAESMSRVSSYDAFGSFVLGPLGAALAGPVAVALGIRATLFGVVGVLAVTQAIVFAQPSVHAIRARLPAAPEPPEGVG